MQHASRTRAAVALLPILGIAPACSFVQPKTQSVAVMATDPTADIFVNGARVGTGTATVELERDRNHEVMARTPDGRSGSAEVKTKMSSAGIVDIVMGTMLIVPLFGLLSPGSKTLSTASVVVSVPTSRSTTQAGTVTR